MTIRPNGRDAWLDRVRDTWNERVDWWDDMSEQNAVAPDRIVDLNRTIASLNLRPGDRIYDAGCGSGQFALAFAERGFSVTAADISPEMIGRGRQHAQKRSLTVDWRVGDLDDAIRADKPFTAIHARMSLQFVPDLPRALQRFANKLAPGGRLYTSVPGATSPIYGSIWQRFLPDAAIEMNYLTPWDLERVLEHFDWRIVEQWPGDDLGLQLDTDESTRRSRQATAFTWTIISER